MAHVIPDGWQALDGLSASVQRELETLRILAADLSDDYTLYHAVHSTISSAALPWSARST